MTAPLLDVRGVSKRFGGLLAVNNVTFSVGKGEILGLIGPNGAGKTTLFNVVNGVYKPDGGSVIFDGQDISKRSPDKVVHLGLARTHQIVKPLANMNVLENVTVGACFGHEYMSLGAARQTAMEVLQRVGLADRAKMSAGALTIAYKKRLEVARALAAKPKLLLLDEVLAGLNPSEVRDMVPVVRAIAERGVAIVMIEHVMQAVMSLAEQVFVLAEGKIIASGAPQDVAADARVIEAYLGRGAAQRVAAGALHG